MKKKILMITVAAVFVSIAVQVLHPLAEVIGEYYFYKPESLTFVVEDEQDEDSQQKDEQLVLAEEHESVIDDVQPVEDDQQLALVEEKIVFGEEVIQAQETEPTESYQSETKIALPGTITPINPELHENQQINQVEDVVEDEITEVHIHQILQEIKQLVNDGNFQVHSVQIEQAEEFLMMIYQEGSWRFGAEKKVVEVIGEQILRVRGETKTHRYEAKANVQTGEVISLSKIVLMTKENRIPE